jgi:hypothetical protein
MSLRDKIDAANEKRIAILTQAIDLQQQLMDRLEKRLLKPKSAFSKVLKVLKEIALVAAGIAIGRGL